MQAHCSRRSEESLCAHAMHIWGQVLRCRACSASRDRRSRLRDAKEATRITHAQTIPTTHAVRRPCTWTDDARHVSSQVPCRVRARRHLHSHVLVPLGCPRVRQPLGRRLRPSTGRLRPPTRRRSRPAYPLHPIRAWARSLRGPLVAPILVEASLVAEGARRVGVLGVEHLPAERGLQGVGIRSG